MSTELATFTAAPLEQRVRYAQTLASAGDLIPRGLRDNRGQPVAGKILLVAETGSMLGMHPIAALQGVNIIDGKPTISPALMSAVVRRAGHKLRVTTKGSVAAGTFEATATLIRADDPEAPFSATWNKERAQRAGLAGKGAWAKYFEAMCKARAISEVCREGAEDALMGVGYVPEELGADVDEQGNVVEAPAAPAPVPAAPAPAPFPSPAPVAAAQPESDVIEGEIVPDRDWAAEARAAGSLEALRALYQEADNAGALGSPVDGPDQVLGRLMRRLRQEFIDAEKAAAQAPARDWLGEARAATSRDALQALVTAAADAGVGADVLQEMASFEESLPAAELDWNAAASETGGEVL